MNTNVTIENNYEKNISGSLNQVYMTHDTILILFPQHRIS